MVLKVNDRRTSCPCHDEFRGPRSDYVRQVALENNNNNFLSTPSTSFIEPALLDEIIHYIKHANAKKAPGRNSHLGTENKVLLYTAVMRPILAYASPRLAMLTAVPLGLGSNPGEDMHVCKYIVPPWHGGTLNSRQVASPLVRLVEGKERWEATDHPQGVLPLNWGETELNRSVTYMVLKATAKRQASLSPLP
ncbi:uncharacterized protein TNCV_21361 [Trichonephila clavipes]|nr:uncharacterized protein TNCV_21361 [Trichonephila clavipes]